MARTKRIQETTTWVDRTMESLSARAKRIKKSRGLCFLEGILGVVDDEDGEGIQIYSRSGGSGEYPLTPQTKRVEETTTRNKRTDNNTTRTKRTPIV